MKKLMFLIGILFASHSVTPFFAGIGAAVRAKMTPVGIASGLMTGFVMPSLACYMGNLSLMQSNAVQQEMLQQHSQVLGGQVAALGKHVADQVGVLNNQSEVLHKLINPDSSAGWLKTGWNTAKWIYSEFGAALGILGMIGSGSSLLKSMTSKKEEQQDVMYQLPNGVRVTPAQFAQMQQQQQAEQPAPVATTLTPEQIKQLQAKHKAMIAAAMANKK